MRAPCGAMIAVVLLAGAPALAQVPVWEEMGPRDTGGRVTALAVDPANPSHLVAGTPAGGVWESTDGGATWQAATLWLSQVPLAAVAVSPADDGTFVLGTGSLTDHGAVERAIGTLRTTDGGAAWAQVGDASSTGFVSTIVYWPGDAQRVLVGTDLGIRLSIDGGVTFAAVLDGEAVFAVVPDRTQTTVALATTRTGLFRSADAGATWARVSSWPLTEDDTFGVGTTALAVSAVTPGLLYASVQVMGSFSETARALLLKSVDGGQTFVTLTPPATFCPAGPSCGFAHALALAPDESRLYLGGERLSVSSDGGLTWQTVASALSGFHAIVPAGGTVYLGGRFGLATLDTGGTTATLRNHGLAVTQIVDLDVAGSASPARVLAGTADSGVVLGDNAAVPDFRVAFAPRESTGGVRFDPFDPSRMLVSRRGGLFFRSQDAGHTFTQATQGLDFAQRSADAAPLAASPVQPRWFTGRLQMFESSTAGTDWAPFRPAGSPEITLIEASPVVDGRVYFATRSGGTLYKADGPTTEAIAVSAEPALRLTSLFLDGAAQNSMYVAASDPVHASGRVFKSADFGVNWIDVTPPSLPPATAIVKDRFGALYVGSSGGVWRSANDGYTWVPFTNGLFAGGVNKLKIGGETIFAGTSGRGIFRTPEQSLFSLESIANNVNFLVDGEPVRAPYLVHWEPGSTHTVTPVLTNTSTSREQFLAWSDAAGTQSRTVTAADTSGWLLAAVRRAFSLQTATAPAGGGSVLLSPSSADGFYDEQSVVTVVPVPAPDHRFEGFSGEISGTDGLVAYARMDRARTVSASFTPLRSTLTTVPAGIPITVDGATVQGPVTYQWPNQSVHTVSVPETFVPAGGSAVLAFDAWTDLLPRTHDVVMSRSTFVTDLTAKYIRTVTSVDVPAAGSLTVSTAGASDAPRLASLQLSPVSPAVDVPRAMSFVRGRIGETDIMEFALVPSAARTWTHAYVEQNLTGAAGRIRLTLFNPGSEMATVGVLLRGPDGAPLAARPDAVRVAPGALSIAFVDELLSVSVDFAHLMSVLSDQPLVTSVQFMRSNRRALDALDPLLVVPLTPGDRGVPADALVQPLLLTPQTDHFLVVANTGFDSVSGTLQFRDAANAPLTLELESGPSSGLAYALPPGGYLTLRFPTPATASGPLPTAWVLTTPTSGPAPMLQLQESTHIPGADNPSAVLPRVVPPSALGTAFWLPVNAAMRETGAVLNNVVPSPMTVTVRAYDPAGTEVAHLTRIVPGYTQAVVSSTDLPGGLATSFVGALKIEAAGLFFGVGYSSFVNARNERSIAGFPLITAAAAAATYPAAIDGDSWTSEWWFLNPTSNALGATLSGRGRHAKRIYFPVE